ncbi:MAG: HPP family protein [Candidatus Sericytochromatia bacterium]
MKQFKKRVEPILLEVQQYLAGVKQPVPEGQIKLIESSGLDADPYEEGLLVGHVMTRKVVCVLESTSIEQVASLCNRRGFSGVPVVNDRHSLIGIVTLSDILHRMLDQKSLSTFAESGGEVLEQRALALLEQPVRNFLQRHVITVTPETSVREACQLMIKHGIRRLVVTRGELVRGIFSAQDAVRVLAEERKAA